ncbi:class I SAM-dependent methyltransferase [bacterium]|nr:class I SAM-dependent methyltransferase [bacterium]
MSQRLYKVIDIKVASRIFCGTVLEIGPGTTWPGQRLLKKNTHLELTGIGFSGEQRAQALIQAKQWGVRTKTTYIPGELTKIPLPDKSIDAVVSFGALHAWEQPMIVFNEIARVLKIEGEFFIGDVRQDATWWQIPWMPGKSQGIRAVYQSRRTAMTASDLCLLLAGTQIKQCRVSISGPDLWITKQ